MIKILGICGSPRKASTEYALGIALEAAKEIEGVEVEMITVRGRDIHPCIHCNKCVNDNSEYCSVYTDGMTELYDKFYNADGYIIASPVYEMNCTAQLAAFFNRFRPTYVRLRADPTAFSNKVGCAIAVGGTRNGGQESTINSIHGFYHTQGITVVNGGLGCYAGASVWSQDKKAQGVQEDECGLKNLKIIGRNLAEKAKIFVDYNERNKK